MNTEVTFKVATPKDEAKVWGNVKKALKTARKTKAHREVKKRLKAQLKKRKG